MPSTIDDIKSRLDIVELIQSYVRLNKAGVNYKALCPFHSEKTPSFIVSPARQTWHCFGCGKGGTHFDFVMAIEGLEFKEALEVLAKRAGIQLKREDPKLRSERTRLHQIVEDAARLYESVLLEMKTPERISAPLAYIKKRGLSDETIKTWRIGFAPESWDFLMNHLKQKGYRTEEIERSGLAVKSEQGSYYDRFRSRIMFPVSDASGRVVGFSGRIFGEESKIKNQESAAAKYINTPQTLIYDKSRVLYGFDKARDEIRKQNAVVLVEGQMDVVMSHQAGIKNTVAVSGTALATHQLQVLKRLASTIISSFDRDQAGEMATKRSLDLASSFGFDRKVAILPPKFKDAADAVLENPEIWKTAIGEAKPVVQFFWESALAKYDANSATGKRDIAREVLPEVKLLTSEVEKSHWLQVMARSLGTDEAALWRELGKAKPTPGTAHLPKDDTAPIPSTRHAQLESLLLGSIILYPGDAHLNELPRHAILDEKHLVILGILETTIRANVQEHQELIRAIPEEFQEAAKYLAFQAEVMLERIENVNERAREILVCMRELEREWAKDKLRSLSAQISRAEADGKKDHLATLLTEFRLIAEKAK
jgi:DNA primase